jgi:hypothetical protein
LADYNEEMFEKELKDIHRHMDIMPIPDPALQIIGRERFRDFSTRDVESWKAEYEVEFDYTNQSNLE